MALAAGAAFAQLPEGPGRAATQTICAQCHTLARALSVRQDRTGWQATVDKMVTMGAKGTDRQFQSIVAYLAKNFAPTGDLPPIHVNTARAIEFEAGLTMRRSQAAAIIAYREEHGPFKSLADLEKVPGIDAARIEAHKDRLAFN